MTKKFTDTANQIDN